MCKVHICIAFSCDAVRFDCGEFGILFACDVWRVYVYMCLCECVYVFCSVLSVCSAGFDV